MKKNKIFGLFLVTTLAISPINSVQAAQNIPQEVIEKAYSKVNKTFLPEEQAFETDEHNVLRPVPIKKDLNMTNNPSSRSIPNDNYTYHFNRYEPDYVNRNWNYDVVSIFRCRNNNNTNMTATYVLESTIVTQGDVTTTITANAQAKAGFLAKLEIEAGVSLGYSKTWQKGWTASVEYTVKPYTTAYLTNYQVAIKSRGAIIFDKRNAGGSLCGTYVETGGGHLVDKANINIELTSTAPNS